MWVLTKCQHSQYNQHTQTDTDNELDDTTIEEGDEQISGAPQASMMCVENPESFRDIICVVPAEGQKPLSFMTDPNFEAMINSQMAMAHIAANGLES